MPISLNNTAVISIYANETYVTTAMARSVREASYLNYNWTYVHVAYGKELTLINAVTVNINKDRNGYVIANLNAAEGVIYHVVIGYASGSCAGAVTQSSWVDIFIKKENGSWKIIDQGPKADPDATIVLQNEDAASNSIRISVYYPVIADVTKYKFHGVWGYS